MRAPFPFPVILLITLMLNMGGCISGQSEGAKNSFASLKVFHLGFIDTFTAAEGKVWDDAKLQVEITKGESQFSTATAGESDPRRKTAFDILHRQFVKDYTFLQTRAKAGKPFYSATMAASKKDTVKQNYDLATKGELNR